MKAATPAGAMPAKVSDSDRAIERAELPVQRNSTVYGRSATARAPYAVWPLRTADAGAACGAQQAWLWATRASRSPLPSP